MGLKDSLPRAPNKSHVYGESFKLPSYSAGPFAPTSAPAPAPWFKLLADVFVLVLEDSLH